MKVEYNSKKFKDVGIFSHGVSITPPINEDYWSLRVRLSEDQAIVAFPKFSTFGIGFQVEDDWNTNFPYTCDANEIFSHIACNKGADSISDSDCINAIRMIQDALNELSA